MFTRLSKRFQKVVLGRSVTTESATARSCAEMSGLLEQSVGVIETLRSKLEAAEIGRATAEGKIKSITNTFAALDSAIRDKDKKLSEALREQDRLQAALLQDQEANGLFRRDALHKIETMQLLSDEMEAIVAHRSRTLEIPDVWTENTVLDLTDVHDAGSGIAYRAAA